MRIPHLKGISILAMIISTISDISRSLDKYKLRIFSMRRLSNLPRNLSIQKWISNKDFNLSQEVGPNYLYGLLDNSARVAIHYSHRISAILVTIVFLVLMSKLWFSAAAPLSFDTWNSFANTNIFRDY